MPAGNLAKWDGRAWSQVGDGVVGEIYALVVDRSGNLYAGGDFWIARQQGYKGVARWDGSAWLPLGSWMVYPYHAVVYALALDGAGNLYAAGSEQGNPELPARLGVSKWDGSAWSEVGRTDGTVRALALDSAGNLFAGGGFTTAGGISANNIAKWDGHAWSAVGSGIGGGAYPRVIALAVDGAGNLFAGGNFATAGGTSANNIARWDGSAWLPLGSGTEGVRGYTYVFALAADAAGDLFAGGDFTIAGRKPASRIARWTADGKPVPRRFYLPLVRR